VGVLSETSTEIREADISVDVEAPHTGDSWAWRLEMAEAIASQLDSERFGVQAMYIFGSTKNATTGPSSDIDLLVHFRGTDEQQEKLLLWLEGWSHCLDELNYLRTGFRTGGLLDVHIITDNDVEKRSNLARKIGAVTDAAKALTLKGS
jgi:predicted nucleotidyltransferase